MQINNLILSLCTVSKISVNPKKRRLQKIREEVMIQSSTESQYSDAISKKNFIYNYEQVFKHIYLFKNILLYKISLMLNKTI